MAHNESSLAPPTYRSDPRNETKSSEPVNPLLPPTPITHEYSRDVLQCPTYNGPRVGPGGGLLGSIRDRTDFEYARLISGISINPDSALGMGFPAADTPIGQDVQGTLPSSTSGSGIRKELAVVTKADKEWWRPDGICEVPEAEEYVSFTFFSFTDVRFLLFMTRTDGFAGSS